jgi:hypothetical protein
MSLTDKIHLYNRTYVDGECRSKKYESKIKQEKRLNAKLDLADTMCNELAFPFTNSQKKHVKELIRTFKNFKDLHSKATNEEIILSFIFYVKALEIKKEIINSVEGQRTIRILIQDFDKQIHFKNTFEIISWKITLHYISTTPILPTEPENVDHNILYKG